MKKFLIFSILALMGVFSSCTKEGDPQIGVGIGVNNGGVWIDIFFGSSTGGYYYPNGFPNSWNRQNEVTFVAYVERMPWSPEGVQLTHGNGKPIMDLQGNAIMASSGQFLKYLQAYDYSKGPLPVYVSGKKDLSGNWYYTII